MKRIKWLVIFLGLVALIIGIGVKYQMDKQEQLRQEMIKIVESDGIQQLIRKGVQNLDEQALSKNGTIISYKIDYDSLRRNPFGGMDIDVIVNGDEQLKIQMTVSDYGNGFEIGGSVVSKELVEKLERK